MSENLYSGKSIFQIRKKFAWKTKIVRFVEIILAFIVLAGTILWLVFSTNFSFPNFFKSLGNSLKPKIASNTAKKNLSDEELLKKLLSEKNLLEVKFLEKTSEKDYKIVTKDGINIYFAKDKSFEDQVSTLQILLAKAKIEGKSLKKVDFRFSKIIVEY